MPIPVYCSKVTVMGLAEIVVVGTEASAEASSLQLLSGFGHDWAQAARVDEGDIALCEYQRLK